ncbi:hypothetical protein Leryth_026229 [Lithospermum erythrorhizon]|nr:hypothetical protein Leryth_026229 [Lithospermum erythrorhizon]
MNNVEVSDDEMELDDNIEAADPSNIASSSHENTARRGYDLPRQRNSGDHPKTVSIFQNILRPDDIPRWFCPEIRFRFNEFWETFEATDEVFRDVMWESFKQWYIVSPRFTTSL